MTVFFWRRFTVRFVLHLYAVNLRRIVSVIIIIIIIIIITVKGCCKLVIFLQSVFFTSVLLFM